MSSLSPPRLATVSCLLSLVQLLSVHAQALDYSSVGAQLEPLVREEMSSWEIGGVAIALVDDQEVIYAHGFGEAQRDSLFRVGSISKLFNAIAVMQQVEAGKLDLDATIAPELLPLNPFPGSPAVTLRQLLCHRSGLQREAPVGGYFDDSQPGLARTVASLRSCVLVTRPGEKTRYSNVGPSLAGQLVEQVSGQKFEHYQSARILKPLGISGAAWTLHDTARDRIVISHMRIADGRGGWSRRQSPLFDLGTIPAGNLFASAEDLGRFASALLANGKGLLRPSSLAEMWRPQLTTEPGGFGIGFMVGQFRGRRAISHSGAVYGHSTSLVLLPDEKLAAIVLANEDLVNGRVRRISNTALSLMLQAKVNERSPPADAPIRAEQLDRFTGEFESQSYWAKLELRDGALIGNFSGQFTRFTPLKDLKFAADSRLEEATPATFDLDSSGGIAGFKLGAERFLRVSPGRPALPAGWRALIGIYGPDFIPLVVSERHGHLYVMTENLVDYRLTPMNRNVCALPPGMYADEHVVFLPNDAGEVTRINFANMVFARH